MNKELLFAFSGMLLSAPLLVAVPWFEHKYGTPKAVTTIAWFTGEFAVVAVLATLTGQYKPLMLHASDSGMWLALLGGATIGAAALYCMIVAFSGDESAAVVMTVVNANPAVAVFALMLLGALVPEFQNGISREQTLGVLLSLPVFYLLASK